MPTQLTPENEAYLTHLHEQRWQVTRYVNGKGLEISENNFNVWPKAIKIVSEDDPLKYAGLARFVSADYKSLPEVEDNSLDFIFVSEQTPLSLINSQSKSHYLSKIKVGGYLIGHSVNAFNVLQKTESDPIPVTLPEKQPKHACVVRYGAFGDMLQTASLLPELKRQGFHITLIGSPKGIEVLKMDPHIDEFIEQQTDVVRNHELGQYWRWLSGRYDKFVNLSESVEGTWLPNSHDMPFHWPPEVRHKYLNVNYVEFMHKLAGVSYENPRVKFYATAEEVAAAKLELAAMHERSGCSKTIVWALAGSSVHKVYPYLDFIIAQLIDQNQEVDIVLVGGPETFQLQGGWQNHPRVHLRASEWDIRQTLTFVQNCAGLVIGPETGVMNAMCMEKTPKIVFLSHSTKENLTRDWRNTASIHADYGKLMKACNQCCLHRLHTSWEYCTRGPNYGAALCQELIDPEEVLKVTLNALRTGRVSGK